MAAPVQCVQLRASIRLPPRSTQHRLRFNVEEAAPEHNTRAHAMQKTAAGEVAHLNAVSLRPGAGAPIINGILPERGKLLREVAYCARSGFVEDEA